MMQNYRQILKMHKPKIPAGYEGIYVNASLKIYINTDASYDTKPV